jgi:hypothetical protein
MSLLSISFTLSASRIALEDLFAFAKAVLFVAANVETDARKRTASGATVALPVPVTVICLVFAEAEGASDKAVMTARRNTKDLFIATTYLELPGYSLSAT